MSTPRYVWDKYALQWRLTYNDGPLNNTIVTNYSNYYDVHHIEVTLYNNAIVDSIGGIQYGSVYKTITWTQGDSVSVLLDDTNHSYYIVAVLYNSSGSSLYRTSMYYVQNTGTSLYDNYSVYLNISQRASTQQMQLSLNLYSHELKSLSTVLSRGSKVGNASSNSSSTYPNGNIGGNNWYEYLGSDDIDPVAVSTPANLRGGEAALVTVTPGTGKVYGGTVSYRYEYSVNGGTSWVLANTTTATSLSITIPEGSPSFQARVRAQDNLGFTSSTYVYSTQVTVINNEPPTAPGSISVGVPVGGQQVTITITAATDPDGQVVNYLYERSIDGNGWTQIASVNALTYNDTVGTEWATVAYRVKAVDDDGAAGPYVTGETSTINSGWLFISGPAENMGNKPAPFVFSVSAGVSGSSGVSDIAMSITLDGVEIYYNTVSDADTVTQEMDTRLMGEGTHTITVAVSKADYLPTSRAYVFEVPPFALPDGGRMEILENQEEQAVFPVTLARAVVGYDGRSVADILEELLVSTLAGAKIETGTYAGGGTFGADSPNLLAFAFPAKVLLLFDSLGAMTVLVPSIGKYSPRLTTSGAGTVSLTGSAVSWYAASAADQLNSSGKTYTYIAIG